MKYKNILAKGLIIAFLAVILIFPGASFRGASTGLLLWFHNVLPSLLPFIILSNLIVRLHITKQISRFFYPVFGRLFKISYEGCYPIIIGFLSGIPMGAKSSADLVSEHKIDRQEGQFLLGMCNNASPMFIIGYISITQLKQPNLNYALFAIIYGASVLGALLYRQFFMQRDNHFTAVSRKDVTVCKITASPRFTFDLLDQSIMNGFEIVTKIGGYIILFSISAQIIREIGPETGIIKALLIGILEITTGISQVSSLNLDLNTKIVLISVLTSFGGLSAVAQTKSVLGNSRLSIHSYLMIKIISAVAALLLSILYVNCFRS